MSVSQASAGNCCVLEYVALKRSTRFGGGLDVGMSSARVLTVFWNMFCTSSANGTFSVSKAFVSLDVRKLMLARPGWLRKVTTSVFPTIASRDTSFASWMRASEERGGVTSAASFFATNALKHSPIILEVGSCLA